MSQNPEAGPTPYCYRHNDRETYIVCQRCGRSICPDCMRQASVGYHCPECVAEAARSVRQPRTVAGGLAPGQVGVVSYALIAINVLAFIGQLATGIEDGDVTLWGGMVNELTRYQLTDGSIVQVDGVSGGEWWRVVSSGFLHFGFLHILFNMYALYLFGPMLERMLGNIRFLAMYATSLLGGSLAVYLFADPHTLTAGASGAIFGLLGCTLVLFLQHGYDVRFLLGLLAINAVITVVFEGISWQAHLGGFVAGVLTGALLGFAPRKGRTYVQLAGLAVLWIAMAAAFVLRTGQLTA